jgi:hypothetical protein
MWFEMDNDYCPFSGKHMSLQDIIVNYSLCTKIQMWIEKNGLAAEKGEPTEDTVEEEGAYMRKLGISNKIEIDTDKFRGNTIFEDADADDMPPIKEIQIVSPSTKKRFPKIPSISKALFHLGAKAA